LIASVIYMFSGYVILRIYPGHLANIDTIVWFCSSLYLLERLFKKLNFFNTCLLGISFALMILAGQIQFAFYGFFAIGIYIFLILILKVKKNIFPQIIY